MKTKIEKERVSGHLGRCMLPLIDTLGWKGGKRSFLNSLPYDYREFDINDMMNTMANLGFKVKVSAGALNSLDARLLPCLFINKENQPYVLISHEQEENGFLSFKGEESRFVTLSCDSSKGSFYFFESITDALNTPDKVQKNWVLNFFTRFKKTIVTAFIISLILSMTTLMSPIIVMGIYTRINTAEVITGFRVIGVGIFAILILDFLFRIFRQRLFSFLGARMSFLVSTQVFRRILSFSPSATENASIGSQIVRMKDFNSVRSFIEGPGMLSLMEFPFLVILFIGLILIAGNLAYIPLIAGLLLLAFSVIILPFVKKNNLESATSGSKKQTYLIEFFSEFREIRMSGLSKKWKEKFDKISAESSLDIYKASNINSLINHVSQAVVSMAGVLTIGAGVSGVLKGYYDSAVLLAAMMLVWKILSPLSTGFSVFSQGIRIKKSLTQLNRLMEMPTEKTNNNMSPISFKGIINFKEVSLRYKPEYYPALLGVNLSANPGDFIVIKGHDGAGKTTLLKLLMGMYKAQTGVITIDGTNIKQLPPSLLRRSISYLPQEDQLFNMSIVKNMKYYSPEASMKDIVNALDSLSLLEEIEKLPSKLDTQISWTKGIKNQVSFRKRLCIARSILNKSNIILLDEPDRGLEDSHLHILVKSLSEIKSGKTVVVASNHPVFEKHANKVISLNMGIIKNVPGKP